MTDSTAHFQWAEEHRRELNRALLHADASHQFLRFINTVIPGVEHKSLYHIYKYHNQDTELAPDIGRLQKAAFEAGGFTRAMWNGKLWDAWTRADGDNRLYMRRAFFEWEIDAHSDLHDKTPSQFAGLTGEWDY